MAIPGLAERRTSGHEPEVGSLAGFRGSPQAAAAIFGWWLGFFKFAVNQHPSIIIIASTPRRVKLN
jgi:hypothetical protein